MSISIVLKKLRELRNITILQLSELSGVSNGGIGNIERGAVIPRKKTLEKIAKALNLNQEERRELFLAILPDDIDENSREISYIDLPVYSNIATSSEFLNLEMMIREEAVIIGFSEKKEKFKNMFMIEINSESMAKTISKGDIVIVDTEKKEIIDNRIYVVTYNSESFISRILKKENYIKLFFDNLDKNKYEEIIIFDHSLLEIRGTVIKVTKKLI